MNAIVIFCVALSSLLVIPGTKGATKLISACPNILTFEDLPENVNDRWRAILELKDTEVLDGLWLNILLNAKADVLINTFGETTTPDNKAFTISKPGYSLARTATLKIRLTVKYNPDNAVPNIVGIRLNGGEICASNVISNPITDSPQLTRAQPSFDVRTPQRDSTCGIKTQARPLVYGGKVSEGYWPWHTAIMLLRGLKYDYHCGGTLISDSYVLTAAHCVTLLTTSRMIETESFILYLGMRHFDEQTPYIKPRLVADIQVHRDYNPAKYHNDLAVIKLSEPIEINDFIRPICLWDEDLDIRKLIGQFGTVVGWGIDNTNKTSTKLMEARLPIVGLETCLYFDTSFFSRYTSPKTYCAGSLNGTAVCSGDSGGGMVFPKPGTSGKNAIWLLRGVVSVSPKDGDSICNTRSYAVFTDVAKHLTWIKKAANLK